MSDQDVQTTSAVLRSNVDDPSFAVQAAQRASMPAFNRVVHGFALLLLGLVLIWFALYFAGTLSRFADASDLFLLTSILAACAAFATIVVGLLLSAVWVTPFALIYVGIGLAYDLLVRIGIRGNEAGVVGSIIEATIIALFLVNGRFYDRGTRPRSVLLFAAALAVLDNGSAFLAGN
jgi:hypothetical protein